MRNDDGQNYRKLAPKKYLEALAKQKADRKAKEERKELLADKKKKLVDTGIIRLVHVNANR